MVNRIRIGNDINIEFTILINGEKANINDAKDLVITVFRNENINDAIPITSLDISSNPIKFTVKGNIEHKPGLYRALITYSKNNPIENETDISHAVDAPIFILVNWSSQQQVGNAIPIMIPPILINGSILQVTTSGYGSDGISIHSDLSNLEFNKSGHIGFASSDSIDELAKEIAKKAPLNSPDFTGIPTAVTADITNRTLQLANTTFVRIIVDNHNESITSHNDIREEMTAKWILLNSIDTLTRNHSIDIISLWQEIQNIKIILG